MVDRIQGERSRSLAGKLEGKTALVTGAGSGIGKASAILFAKEGARVGVLSRTKDEIQKTVEDITKMGGKAIAIEADISEPKDMENAMQRLVDVFGSLEIIFANAGINGVWAPIEELTPEDWDKTLGINLRGTFLTVKYAVPYLKRQGGSIVITSSVNGTRVFSNTGATAYSTSKAGQVAFTKMVALELAKFKIRVNVICPGAIITEIDENTQKRDLEKVQEPVIFPEGTIPLTGGRPGTAEEVARLVLFLVSEDSDLITGTEVWIDGAGSLIKG
jgi:NAD(P)-dependent dehydrogenase (short-subunit alcohol dehydrogenase family)